jgi:hypothetical protein
MAVAWVPFRDGKWVWYEGLGYTWVSAEPWGWLPFHYGRWMLREGMGWFWVPGTGAIFKPGETFWLAGKGVAGWGPLAPGEVWVPPAMPQLFLNAHTTFAKFAPDSREIDPAGFASRPREPLSTATFVAAMPSPAFPAARLDAVRPVLRAGSTRVVLNLPGVTFESAAPVPERQRVSETVAGNPPPVAQTQTVIQPASPQPAVVVTVPQPEQPMEVYYPVPVYTGVVVVNPPERNHGHRREPERPLPANPTPVTRSPDKPPEQIVPQAPAPAPAVRRTETDHRRPEQAKAEPERPKPEPAKEEKSDNPDQPIPRNQESGRQPDSGRRK